MGIDSQTVMVALGLLVMFAMAYAEGANDVSKVVATLVGSGIANYRRAISYGSLCTAIGAFAAVFLSREVAVTLTKGLVTSGTPVNEAFALAALIGAMTWVLVATRVAMPVSSSHAIIGSILILAACVFGPRQVRWDAVWSRLIFPMAASPLIAIPLSLGLHRILRSIGPHFSLATWHWVSVGAASFARGVSDAPKIAALGAFFYLAGEKNWLVPVVSLFPIVAIGMTLGSLIAGRRVTETLAERVTVIGHAEGLAANATTAVLVIWASRIGLPVSITHVISSSIIGLGLRRGIEQVSWQTVGRMGLAWLVTLPTSGILASLSYWLIHIWM
jgi:PiT family inorganic phosphate transporter